MDKKEIETLILDYVHMVTGWGKPLRPYCEYENLQKMVVRDPEKEEQEISFEYLFDEDGFSQYDKCHILEGKITIDSNGEIVKESLEEIHRGIAAVLSFTKVKYTVGVSESGDEWGKG